MKHVLTLALFIAFASATAAQTESTAPAQKLKVMQETLLIAATNFTDPANSFTEDNDPNTLQIVFLSKPEQGNSHVSEDGGVVFMSPDASQASQQELISRAFDFRVQRRLNDGQF